MIRGKQPEANLRLNYGKVLWTCIGISAIIQALLFAIFPSFEAKAYAKAEAPHRYPVRGNSRDQTGAASTAASAARSAGGHGQPRYLRRCDD